MNLNHVVTALVSALSIGGARPAIAALPVCGEGMRTLRDGGTFTAEIFGPKDAMITMDVAFPTDRVKANGFRFKGKSTLNLRLYRWDDTPTDPDFLLSFGYLVRNDEATGGILQLECGRRNMGLINWPVGDGTVYNGDGTARDSANCLSELFRDGGFRLSLDQGDHVTTLLTGTLNIRAAEIEADAYIAEQVRKAKAGLCDFVALPMPN